MLPFFAVEKFTDYTPNAIAVNAINLCLSFAFKARLWNIGVGFGFKCVAEEIVQVHRIIGDDAQANVSAFWHVAGTVAVLSYNVAVLLVPLNPSLGVE